MILKPVQEILATLETARDNGQISQEQFEELTQLLSKAVAAYLRVTSRILTLICSQIESPLICKDTSRR